jgi:hypothetical protein
MKNIKRTYFKRVFFFLFNKIVGVPTAERSCSNPVAYKGTFPEASLLLGIDRPDFYVTCDAVESEQPLSQ